MNRGIHGLMRKTMGLAVTAGAAAMVYGLIFTKNLGWRAKPIRRTAAVIAAAGLMGRCLVPRRGTLCRKNRRRPAGIL